MENLVIEYNGQDYEVKEPTLDMFMKLTLLKEIQEETDFRVDVVSLSTGISEEDVKKARYDEIKKASDFLSQYFLNLNENFHKEFEFENTKYRFIDLQNITFGEYIDIDTYLQQPEHLRQTSLHKFLAYLYREVDESNNLVEYNIKDFEPRAEKFRNLPVKYLHGALNFFFILERTLQENTHSYLRKKMLINQIKQIPRNLLVSIGDGMLQSYSWLMKTLPNWMKSQNTPSSMFLTFLHTLRNSIKKGIKK